LVNNAGIFSPGTRDNIRSPQNFEEAHRVYDVNALGPLRVAQAFLPLTERGALKRLCFVSSEAGSIERSRRRGWFGYCMSKAALNMGVSILFNDLRPQGYTFRLYHPGYVRSYMNGAKNTKGRLEPETAGSLAAEFFLKERGDEDRLTLVGFEGKEWPW